MPAILRIVTNHWSLEIGGHIPSLPAHIPRPIDTTIKIVSTTASAEVWNRAAGGLVAYAPGQQSEPLFFENVTYDIYLTSTAAAVEPQFGFQTELRHVVRNSTST